MILQKQQAQMDLYSGARPRTPQGQQGQGHKGKKGQMNAYINQQYINMVEGFQELDVTSDPRFRGKGQGVHGSEQANWRQSMGQYSSSPQGNIPGRKGQQGEQRKGQGQGQQ